MIYDNMPRKTLESIKESIENNIPCYYLCIYPDKTEIRYDATYQDMYSEVMSALKKFS